MDLDKVLEMVRNDLDSDARKGILPHDVATRMFTKIRARLIEEKRQKSDVSSAGITDPLVADYVKRAEQAERDASRWD